MAEPMITDVPETTPPELDGGGHEPWHLSVARLLGRVSRWAADGGGHRVELGPRDPTMTVLLTRLGEVVSAHAANGYGTLADDPELWAVLDGIHVASDRARAVAGDGEAVDGIEVEPLPRNEPDAGKNDDATDLQQEAEEQQR